MSLPPADDRHPPAARIPQPETEPPPEWFEPGLIPPDPDEPPPVELWSAVGDVPPFATVLMLLACGMIFAGQAFRLEIGDHAALIAWGGNVSGAAGLDALWRLLASTLIHGGGLHLLLNSISLLMFGPAVEAIFARAAFPLIWVAGGAFASESSLLVRAFRHGGPTLGVGASGAIFALAGALLAASFRLRHRLAPGRARALAAAMLFLVVQSIAGAAAEHGTDNVAHVAGLIAGVTLGAFAPLNARLGGRAPKWTAVAGALAVLALAATFTLSMVRGLATP